MDTTETLPVVSRKLIWEVAPKPLAEINEGLRAEVTRLLEEAQVAAVRHQMAQAFTQMQMMGYSALLNYGVNFQELPAYKDPGGYSTRRPRLPSSTARRRTSSTCAGSSTISPPRFAASSSSFGMAA